MKRGAICSVTALLSLSISIAIVIAIPSVASAAENPVSAARHDGTVGPTSIRWRTEYVLRADAARTIDLAFPLPPGTELEATTDVAPVVRNGRLVALRVLPEAATQGRVEVSIVEPLERRGNTVRLAVPLASGDGVQIATVTGGDDLHFEPDARTLLERHVGFFAPAELAPSVRDACDRAVGYVRSRSGDDPMYVQALPRLVADEGISGTLSSGGERARVGVLGAGGVFIGLVVSLLLVHKKLAHAAQLERAEQALAADFDHLDERGAKRG